MISHLRGTVIDMSGAAVTIDVAGVGYEVQASRALLARLEPGAAAQVVVYTDVREDSIKLFGFSETLEKQVFLLLLRVTGIGAKTGLELVSALQGRDLLRIIAEGDLHSLQSVKGIGRKTAERIILELRDRVAELAQEVQTGERPGRGVDGAMLDAIQALQALGFSRSDAETAVRAAHQDGKITGGAADAGSIVKEALRYV